MKTILETQSLSIGYSPKGKSNVIASDLNLMLRSGKLIALIGENGIGKSTFLRTLTGIQKPLSGTVLLNGKPIEKFNPLELAQQLSVVLTEKLPPSNLTVSELVALGRQPYTNWIGTLTQEDRVKINEAIALAEIGPFRDKKHYEISDGQLQKVLIARAIAQDTPLIILDEPATHLDLQHKVSLFRLLKNLSRTFGKCILFSSHDLELALQLSDEIILMTKGKTVHGSPQELTDSKAFDTLFDPEQIRFDAANGKFIFKGL